MKYRLQAPLAAALLLFTFAASASARDWPDAGGFEIVEADQFCLMSMEYEGPGDSQLSVGIFRDGAVALMVTNTGWSAKEGQKYEDITFRLNGTAFGGGSALGVKETGRTGFTTKMGSGFLEHFIKSTYLHVYKGEQVIDQLKLNGSSAAVAMTRRCLTHVDALRSAEEREKRRFESLPKDPFAGK